MESYADTGDIVYALAATRPFVPRTQGVCFAARASGLYRSLDGGATWHPAYESMRLEQPLATIAVALSPDFVMDRTVFAGAQGGILRSFDAGETWEIIGLTSPPPLVACLVVSPDFEQDGTLLAGTTEDGIFRSSDRGRTWSAWNFGLLDLNVLSLTMSPAFAEDETLYAGTETGIFRSMNGGRAWREVGFPNEYAPVLSIAISPDFARDGTLFVGTESRGVFHSADRGGVWTHIDGVPNESVNLIWLSAVFPGEPHILAATGEGLFLSLDGGATWAPRKSAPMQEGSVVAVIAPDHLTPDAPLLVGTDSELCWI